MFAAIPTVATALIWGLVAFAVVVVIVAAVNTIRAIKGLASAAGEAGIRLKEATGVLEEEKSQVAKRVERLGRGVTSEGS